jgi:hypothetical protein
LLKESGIDPKRDNVQIAPPPMPANPAGVSFGVNAAKAMEEGKIDGFWANGMGAEVAVQRGLGTMVLDARRGDGPRQPARLHLRRAGDARRPGREEPEKGRGRGARAGQDAQGAEGRSEARHQGRREVVSGVRGEPDRHAGRARSAVLRPDISKRTFDSMCKFVQTVGLTKGLGKYEDVWATQFSNLWKA